MVCVHTLLQFTHSTCTLLPLNLYSFLSLVPSSLPPIFSSSSSSLLFFPSPSSHFPQIIYILITLAMEEHDTHRELASVLISDLYSHTVNSRDIASSKYHVACYELQTECLHFTLLTWSWVTTWVSPLLPTPNESLEKVFTHSQLQDAHSGLGQGLTWFLKRC